MPKTIKAKKLAKWTKASPKKVKKWFKRVNNLQKDLNKATKKYEAFSVKTQKKIDKLETKIAAMSKLEPKAPKGKAAKTTAAA